MHSTPMIEAGGTRDILTFEAAITKRGSRAVRSTLDALPSTLESVIDKRVGDGVGLSQELLSLLPILGGLATDNEVWPATFITRALLGIMSTGSVVVAETRRDRIMTFLAGRHVALLPASAIVPSLREAASFLRAWAREGKRYVTFISGPSRTSDIEQIPIIGAHGPGESVVVLVEGWEPELV
jgi:hypothetical protein